MGAAEVFNGKSRWVSYQAELQVATLVGGIPKDPDTVRKWLKARLELEDAEILAITNETLAEMAWAREAEQAPQVAQLTTDQLDELVDAVMAKDIKGNSFKMIDGQLVYEGRCMKGGLKEAANACYPGVRKWPGHPGDNMRKGLASYFVERVEVVERYLPLGRAKPDIEGEQRIKHVTVPGQGKRSAINVVDVVEDVKLTVTVRVLDDCIPPQLWQELWEYIELGGLGADRARGDGRCELLSWTKL